MAGDLLLVTKDTIRGLSSKKVAKGTLVTVIASRRDDDGLKLLVAVGKGTGQRFQIRADETDYKENV